MLLSGKRMYSNFWMSNFFYISPLMHTGLKLCMVMFTQGTSEFLNETLACDTIQTSWCFTCYYALHAFASQYLASWLFFYTNRNTCILSTYRQWQTEFMSFAYYRAGRSVRFMLTQWNTDQLWSFLLPLNHAIILHHSSQKVDVISSTWSQAASFE